VCLCGYRGGSRAGERVRGRASQLQGRGQGQGGAGGGDIADDAGGARGLEPAHGGRMYTELNLGLQLENTIIEKLETFV